MNKHIYCDEDCIDYSNRSLYIDLVWCRSRVVVFLNIKLKNKNLDLLVIISVRDTLIVVAELGQWRVVPNNIVDLVRSIVVLGEHHIAHDEILNLLSHRRRIVGVAAMHVAHQIETGLRAEYLVCDVNHQVEAVLEFMHGRCVARPDLQTVN